MEPGSSNSPLTYNYVLQIVMLEIIGFGIIVVIIIMIIIIIIIMYTTF